MTDGPRPRHSGGGFLMTRPRVRQQDARSATQTESRKGRQFMINNAKIWTLWDADKRVCGQAASFSEWHWI